MGTQWKLESGSSDSEGVCWKEKNWFIRCYAEILKTIMESDVEIIMQIMGVWQAVAMDSLKFHSGLPCPTLQHPACGSPLKRPFKGWTTHRAGGLWPSSTPLDTPCHVVGTVRLLTGMRTAMEKSDASSVPKSEAKTSLRNRGASTTSRRVVGAAAGELSFSSPPLGGVSR
jgi:hypothetical protein